MINTVPIQDVRYKTSDGTHWNTEGEAILHEIECAIGEDVAPMAKLVSTSPKDFQEGWLNGDKKLV